MVNINSAELKFFLGAIRYMGLDRGMMTPPRVNVLGVGVSVLNLRSAVEHLHEVIRQGRQGYVCVTGVHGVMEAQDDPAFRGVLNGALLNTPDGMPLVWMGRFAGFGEISRVYGPDLMLEIFAASAANDWRHFFYGGANGAAVDLKKAMEDRFPGVNVVGTYEPPFRPLDDGEKKQLISVVDREKPHFFWVGLSTPKQEKFMADHLRLMNVNVMLGVGAAFDFHSGRVKQAPRWIQRSGFEWLYRVYCEPRRLWRRYFRNNPRFVAAVLAQQCGFRKFSLD